MTREELIAELATRRTKSTTLDWTALVAAIAQAPQITKAAIVDAVNTNNSPVLMVLMTGIFKDKRRELALADVNQKLADDKLSVDELLEIMG